MPVITAIGTWSELYIHWRENYSNQGRKLNTPCGGETHINEKAHIPGLLCWCKYIKHWQYDTELLKRVREGEAVGWCHPVVFTCSWEWQLWMSKKRERWGKGRQGMDEVKNTCYKQRHMCTGYCSIHGTNINAYMEWSQEVICLSTPSPSCCSAMNIQMWMGWWSCVNRLCPCLEGRGVKSLVTSQICGHSGNTTMISSSLEAKL